MTIKCLALVVDVQKKNGSMLAHWGSKKQFIWGGVRRDVCSLGARRTLALQLPLAFGEWEPHCFLERRGLKQLVGSLK